MLWSCAEAVTDGCRLQRLCAECARCRGVSAGAAVSASSSSSSSSLNGVGSSMAVVLLQRSALPSVTLPSAVTPSGGICILG